MAKKQRPDVLNGKTSQYSTNCGKVYLTLNDIDDQLGEIRITLGKSGHCQECMLTFIGILLSMILQSDYEKPELVKLFRKHGLGISCGEPFIIKGEKYKSCLDLVSQKCIEELNKEVKECAEQKTT